MFQPAAAAMRLTKREIDRLAAPESGDRIVFDDDVKGFALRITAKGARVFLFQFWQGGRNHRLRLGTYPDLTPAQARRLAEAERVKVAGGRNPVADRKVAAVAEKARAEADAFTVAALVDAWEAGALRDARPRYRAEATRALRTGLAALATKPAAGVELAELRRLVLAVAADRPVMARRLHAYARAAWGWAVGQGHLTVNPWLAVKLDGRETSRDRVLTDVEIGEVWRAAGALGWPFAPYVRILLLTLQRRDEVAGMAWSELSPDQAVWTQPAARTKNGKAHIVHLAAPARAILASLPRIAIEGGASPLVFTVTGTTPVSGFSKAKTALDEAIVRERAARAAETGATPAPLVPWRFHDFRRTGATVLARNGVDWAVADKLLNHVQGAIHGVAAVYQRHDFLAERRAASELWAAHVLRQASGG